MTYSLEQKFEIWDDKSGTRLEIGPDRDGCDLIEFRQYTDDNKIGERLTITKDEAIFVLIALKRLLGEQ